MKTPNDELGKIVEDITGSSFYRVKEGNGICTLQEHIPGIHPSQEHKPFFSGTTRKAGGILGLIAFSLGLVTACATTTPKGRAVLIPPAIKRTYTDVTTQKQEELSKKYGIETDPNALEGVLLQIFKKAFPEEGVIKEYKPLIYGIEGTKEPTDNDAGVQFFQEAAILDGIPISGGRLLTEQELVKYGMTEKEAQKFCRELINAEKKGNINDLIQASQASPYRGGVLVYVGKIGCEHSFVAIPYKPSGSLGKLLAKCEYNIIADKVQGKHYCAVPLHFFTQSGSQIGEVEVYPFTDNNVASYLRLDPRNSYYRIQMHSFSGEELEKIAAQIKKKDPEHTNYDLMSHLTRRTGLTGRSLDWFLGDNNLLTYPALSTFKEPFPEFDEADITYLLGGAGPNKFRYAAIIPGSNCEPVALAIFDIHGNDVTVSPPPDLLRVEQPYHELKAALGNLGKAAMIGGFAYLLAYRINYPKTETVEKIVIVEQPGHTGGPGR